MLACLVMALVGFLTFGDKTLGNVLNNFPADNVMVNVARLYVSLSTPPSLFSPLPKLSSIHLSIPRKPN